MDVKYSKIPNPPVDENTKKMQNLALQKAYVQNADMANVLPRDSGSPKNLSQTQDTDKKALKYPIPPKLPFLADINQLQRKEIDMEHIKRNLMLPDKKNNNLHDGHEETRPPLKGLTFLKEIKSVERLNSKDFERNNSE